MSPSLGEMLVPYPGGLSSRHGKGFWDSRLLSWQLIAKRELPEGWGHRGGTKARRTEWSPQKTRSAVNWKQSIPCPVGVRMPYFYPDAAGTGIRSIMPFSNCSEVSPSTVTWRSSMHSSKLDCVRGMVRLISSANSTLVMAGPGRKENETECGS